MGELSPAGLPRGWEGVGLSRACAGYLGSLSPQAWGSRRNFSSPVLTISPPALAYLLQPDAPDGIWLRLQLGPGSPRWFRAAHSEPGGLRSSLSPLQVGRGCIVLLAPAAEPGGRSCIAFPLRAGGTIALHCMAPSLQVLGPGERLPRSSHCLSGAGRCRITLLSRLPPRLPGAGGSAPQLSWLENRAPVLQPRARGCAPCRGRGWPGALSSESGCWVAAAEPATSAGGGQVWPGAAGPRGSAANAGSPSPEGAPLRQGRERALRGGAGHCLKPRVGETWHFSHRLAAWSGASPPPRLCTLPVCRRG
ncbi:ankyrin repeat and SOCS box protein 5 [Platysternon megacephalum]|uniref:Ankyrin repeat and SOCS box protein 5 n=1 Tax=Platysternon megacephalum TaxID=55544 RepID=A0A4D9F395_9SAUR|nr:ankyrin repeat and SOCS box protein 5 [Platysternon megacephalum]